MRIPSFAPASLRNACLSLMMIVGIAASAQATPLLLDFDDIATPNCVSGIDYVPAGYGGFIWSSNWGAECDADYMTTYLNSTGAPSPANAAFNESAMALLEIARTTPFTFTGGLFSGWAFEDSITEGYTAQDITITGYLAGNFVDTTGLQTLTGTYTFINGFAGPIDQLVFSTNSGAFWLMDNVGFDVEATAVPEPASLLLMGTGLLGAVRFVRRRSS